MQRVDALDRTRTNGLAYLAPSRICEGTGVFARRDLARGSFVTAYAGVQYSEMRCLAEETTKMETRSRTRKDDGTRGRYVYVTDDGTVLDGARPGNSRWTRHGLAHMVNDAIDADLNGGEDNNCEFKEVRVGGREKGVWRVYLKTTREIAAHEELLVPYGLDYWLHPLRLSHDPECRDFLASLPDNTLHYLCCHRYVENLLGERVKGLKLSQFQGYVDDSEEGEEGDVLSMAYIVTHDDDAFVNCTCLEREHRRRCARWIVKMTAAAKDGGGEVVHVNVRCTWCHANTIAEEEKGITIEDSNAKAAALFFHTIMSLRRKDL